MVKWCIKAITGEVSGMNETLAGWIKESKRIVFFGGAGVSTESGIPDFRSVDGLYNQQYDYPPETILSHTFFMRKPEEFFRFYRNKMLFPDARPNAAHRALFALEKAGKLRGVVTQNIDGLHKRAGKACSGRSSTNRSASSASPARGCPRPAAYRISEARRGCFQRRGTD